MPRTTPMMSDPIDWKNPTTVLIPAEIPFLMPSQMVETMRPIPLQAASQMLRIRFTAFVMMELTMLIAPITTPLMTSQMPERICLMPSHAAPQSPLMIAVTVLMMPTTILRAPWTIGTIACTTVVTTFRTAWIAGTRMSISVVMSGTIACTTDMKTGISEVTMTATTPATTPMIVASTGRRAWIAGISAAST